MRRRERPAADIKLFESLGFAASVTEVELPRQYSILNYIKYGYSQYSKYQFVVKGVKAALVFELEILNTSHVFK